MLMIEEHKEEGSCDITMTRGDKFISIQIAAPLISSVRAREEFLSQYFRKEPRW